MAVLPPGAQIQMGGKSYKASEKPRPVSDKEPLTLKAAGLQLTVTRGSVARKPDGTLQVVITR